MITYTMSFLCVCVFLNVRSLEAPAVGETGGLTNGYVTTA
jgi:hypothetical protein